MWHICPVEVRFKWTNTLPHVNVLFWGLWDEGFTWDGCSALLPSMNRRPNLCPPGTGPPRLRQEGWLQNRRDLGRSRLRGKAGAHQTREGPGVDVGPQGRCD